MRYGLDKFPDGNRIEATKEIRRAFCAVTGATLIAKTGECNVWHWAYENGVERDSWSEGMSDWHIDWQNKWPKEQREFTIKDDENWHRADIITKDGIVIELQHSGINSETIQARENFYKKMIWLFDAQDWGIESWDWNHSIDNLINFNWKHQHKALKNCKYLFLDLGTLILYVYDYNWLLSKGKGIIVRHDEFNEDLVKNVSAKVKIVDAKILKEKLEREEQQRHYQETLNRLQTYKSEELRKLEEFQDSNTLFIEKLPDGVKLINGKCEKFYANWRTKDNEGWYTCTIIFKWRGYPANDFKNLYYKENDFVYYKINKLYRPENYGNGGEVMQRGVIKKIKITK